MVRGRREAAEGGKRVANRRCQCRHLEIVLQSAFISCGHVKRLVLLDGNPVVVKLLRHRNLCASESMSQAATFQQWVLVQGAVAQVGNRTSLNL